MSHTRTPWYVKTVRVNVAIKNADGGYVVQGPSYVLDDLHHIVRCVNAHDNLVAALRELIQVEGHGECPVDGLHPDIAAAWRNARTALASS